MKSTPLYISCFLFFLSASTGFAQPINCENNSFTEAITPVSTGNTSSRTANATRAVNHKQKAHKYFVPKIENSSITDCYAKFMQVDEHELLPTLYEVIDEWFGTPYRYGFNKKKTGTDCSGFVGKVYEELFEVQLPRRAADIAKLIIPKNKNELQEGDLLFFNYYGRQNSHIGIYLQNGWFMHASTVYGVTLANLNHPYYQHKFTKGGTVKNFDITQFKNARTVRNEIYIVEKAPTLLSTLLN